MIHPSSAVIGSLCILLLSACGPTAPALPISTGTQQSSLPADDAPQVAAIGMFEGKLFTMMADGTSRPFGESESFLFGGGTTVTGNGMVTRSDGHSILLQEGDIVTVSGEYKPGILGPDPPPSATETIPEGMEVQQETMQAPKGSYSDYAEGVLADGSTKVLFFHAKWCPICKAADLKIKDWYAGESLSLPTYKVNYDASSSLKKKYGVTYQHTFVLVDGQGNLIKLLPAPTDQQLLQLLSRKT